MHLRSGIAMLILILKIHVISGRPTGRALAVAGSNLLSLKLKGVLFGCNIVENFSVCGSL